MYIQTARQTRGRIGTQRSLDAGVSPANSYVIPNEDPQKCPDSPFFAFLAKLPYLGPKMMVEHGTLQFALAGDGIKKPDDFDIF